MKKGEGTSADLTCTYELYYVPAAVVLVWQDREPKGGLSLREEVGTFVLWPSQEGADANTWIWRQVE